MAARLLRGLADIPNRCGGHEIAWNHWCREMIAAVRRDGRQDRVLPARAVLPRGAERRRMGVPLVFVMNERVHGAPILCEKRGEPGAVSVSRRVRILARYEDLFARMTQRVESWSDELPVFKVRSDKVDQPISIAERPRRRVRKIVGAARDCQEFRAEVGHDRSKGARQCRNAKNPVYLTPF